MSMPYKTINLSRPRVFRPTLARTRKDFHSMSWWKLIIRFLVYCLGCVPENDLKGWCREI